MSEVVRRVAARVFDVTGDLGAAASNASMAWRQRRGLLLELCDREGRIGQGEASPLPGFSSDTLVEARADLLGVDWAALPDLAPGDGLLDPVDPPLRHAEAARIARAALPVHHRGFAGADGSGIRRLRVLRA